MSLSERSRYDPDPTLALGRKLRRRIAERIKREAAAQDAAEEADETKRKLQADHRKDR